MASARETPASMCQGWRQGEMAAHHDTERSLQRAWGGHGGIWVSPSTDLVEDVEVPLTGGLVGHAGFL